jgi:hypothetical protein
MQGQQLRERGFSSANRTFKPNVWLVGDAQVDRSCRCTVQTLLEPGRFVGKHYLINKELKEKLRGARKSGARLEDAL